MGPPGLTGWRSPGRLDGDVIRRNNHALRGRASSCSTRASTHAARLAVVEATSAHDVAEAIRFARRFDLAARPRAGGHSYVGASTVDDGLVIDVGRIDDTRYDAVSRRATVGAGAQLYDVHAALARARPLDPDRHVSDGRCGRADPGRRARRRQP